MFSNLKHLNFGVSSSNFHELSFDISPPMISSSILLELHVVVDSYTDCLYLLDGRFDQLHTFYITICSSYSPLSVIDSEVSYSH